jgi:hypothetical protein
VAVVLSLSLFVTPVFAGEGGELMCPAPIMVCGNSAGTPDGCPEGYDCACVPSCPNCRDCAARVCVPGAEPECRTACDCEPGLGCFDKKCIAGFAPVFCCESEQCPAGQQCQHRSGRFDRCSSPDPECRTACDCENGQACRDGNCVTTDVPAYCCESDDCPAGQPCVHRSGREGQCKPKQACADHAWLCGDDATSCGNDRTCACSAACPSCENCGPRVCVPPQLGINPYNCNDDGSCDRPGDRCACVSSCQACDDCALHLCMPACDRPDRACDHRRNKVRKALEMVTQRSLRCSRDEDCSHVDTTTECEGTCGVFVNDMRRSFVARAVRYLDHKVCSTYKDDGCPYATPGCLQGVPACIAGRCTYAPPTSSNAAGKAAAR